MAAAQGYERSGGGYVLKQKSAPGGVKVSGATIGILGMGAIGYEVARRALGFKMKVLYHNRNRRCVKGELQPRFKFVPRGGGGGTHPKSSSRTSLIRFEHENANLRNCQDASGWRSGRPLTRGAAERKFEPAVGGDEIKEILKMMVSGTANPPKYVKWWCSGTDFFVVVICENDMLRNRNSGLKMGGLSRSTYPICIVFAYIYGSTPPGSFKRKSKHFAQNNENLVTAYSKGSLFRMFVIPKVRYSEGSLFQRSVIEYWSDDATKKTFFVFQRFGYHVSVEHDEKTSSAQIWWESVHGGPRYGGMNTYLAPLKSV